MLKMTRRRAALAGIAAVGAVALTGCDKPTPEVTVVSGSDSVNSQAACYNHNGKALDQAKLEDCFNKHGKTLTVRPGSRVSVGVDQSIADNGWQLAVNNQPQTQAPLKTTYFDQIQLPYDPATYNIAVAEVGEKGGGRGVWIFQVKVEN